MVIQSPKPLQINQPTPLLQREVNWHELPQLPSGPISTSKPDLTLVWVGNQPSTHAPSSSALRISLPHPPPSCFSPLASHLLWGGPGWPNLTTSPSTQAPHCFHPNPIPGLRVPRPPHAHSLPHSLFLQHWTVWLLPARLHRAAINGVCSGAKLLPLNSTNAITDFGMIYFAS